MNQHSICKYVSFLYLSRKIESKMQDSEFLLYVEDVIDRLPIDQRRIIINDYFITENKKVKNWYLEYYSTATYYRLKKQAIINFVNLLNNEKML